MKLLSKKYFIYGLFMLSVMNSCLCAQEEEYVSYRLQDAIEEHDLDEVKKIVQTSPEIVTDGDVCGGTALHYAAEVGSLPIVKYLVEECGARVDIADQFGRVPVFNAVEGGHLDVLKYLVEECGAELNVRDMALMSLLHAAYDHLLVVQYLVLRGLRVDVQSRDRETPLFDAAWAGKYDVVNFLIENNANVCIANKDGQTPLHKAVWYQTSIGESDIAIVKRLLQAGANINAADKDGETPLSRAVRYKPRNIYETNMVLCLLEHNAALGPKELKLLKQNFPEIYKKIQQDFFGASLDVTLPEDLERLIFDFIAEE